MASLLNIGQINEGRMRRNLVRARRQRRREARAIASHSPTARRLLRQLVRVGTR